MNMECEVVCYIWVRTIDFVLFACKRPRGTQGLAPGLLLSIILTLLSMCGTKIKRTCSRPAGSKSLWSTWTFACEKHKVNSPDSYPRGTSNDAPKQIIVCYRLIYNIRLHIPCSYFTFSLGFFHFLFHTEAANRKQIVNIATMW